jgi:hypothetical protein
MKSSLPTAPFIRIFLRTVTVAALCGCGSAGTAMMPGTTTPAAPSSLTQHSPGPLVTNLKSFTLSLSKKQILPLLVAKQQNASWGIAVESNCKNMYAQRVTGHSPTPDTPGLAIIRYHQLTPESTGKCYWKFIALGSGNRKISVTVRATVTP